MDFIFDTLYCLQLIFNIFSTFVFLLFVIQYKTTIYKFNITKFFKIFLNVFFSFMFIYGTLGVVYEYKKVISGHNIKNFNKNPVLVKDSTDYLIVVAQGISLSPHEDVIPQGKTNVDVSLLRDNTGLGIIHDTCFTNKTQVLTYSATHDLDLSATEMLTSILYYNKLNPFGKIILVGHSVGGYDLIKVCEKLDDYNINVDLLITMDNSNIDEYSVNMKIPENVKTAINFRSLPNNGITQKIMSGGIVERKSLKTTCTNVTLPNCEHTNIDNTLSKPILRLLKNYIDDDGNPILFLHKLKKLEVVPNSNLYHTEKGLVNENPLKNKTLINP